MKLLITGGTGFIGSAVIRYLIGHTDHVVLNVDKLTYAANPESLALVQGNPRYNFEQIDIADRESLQRIFSEFRPDAVMHLAAESHVDRSIEYAGDFVQTNVVGTYVLLEVARKYWSTLAPQEKQKFRFHHVSTDEVYGDLHGTTNLFTEKTPYAPHSPYSATKAASDHLVRAWNRTYGFPTLVSNCSNNYGPYQFPEKLIPHIMLNALHGKKLPVYGDGQQVRDWLYVDDHARALYIMLTRGRVGETYNIGGHNEQKNLSVVETICDVLEECAPQYKGNNLRAYRDLISFVKDRPGHDMRYAIDASKMARELNWRPRETFQSGLRKTIEWYLENESWWQRVLNGSYQLERKGI